MRLRQSGEKADVPGVNLHLSAEAPQPMPEDCLLTSPLEYTNEPYAIAKIAGIKLCESYNLQYGTNYISVMPTNLYGPNDNFDLEKSHVLPALIRKIHLGKCLEENNGMPSGATWIKTRLKELMARRPVRQLSASLPNTEYVMARRTTKQSFRETSQSPHFERCSR
jgi:hypothetical protein